MTFGLGTKHQDKRSVKQTEKPQGKSAQANEAAEMLKKMQAKKDAGACPFC